jgi:hypothetical protein
MKCEDCNADIRPGEEREHLGRVLCEDCCMTAMSPAKPCDPWAVHSAKTFEAASGGSRLTPVQSEILAVLKETGGVAPAELASRLGDRLAPGELEREFAALRHMEKARAEKRGDAVVWRLW